jgi:hypothetical protein
MISHHHLEQDDFWDISAQEKKTQDFFRTRIDQLERVISLGRKTLSLRAQPGFQEFIGAIQDLRDAEVRKLLGFDGPTDQMRVIQGKTRALSDIIGLLADTDNSIKALENQLKIVKNDAARVLTPDGKVITNKYGGSYGKEQ